MSSVAATSVKARNTQHRVRVTGRSPVPGAHVRADHDLTTGL